MTPPLPLNPGNPPRCRLGTADPAGRCGKPSPGSPGSSRHRSPHLASTKAAPGRGSFRSRAPQSAPKPWSPFLSKSPHHQQLLGRSSSRLLCGMPLPRLPQRYWARQLPPIRAPDKGGWSAWRRRLKAPPPFWREAPDRASSQRRERGRDKSAGLPRPRSGRCTAGSKRRGLLRPSQSRTSPRCRPSSPLARCSRPA